MVKIFLFVIAIVLSFSSSIFAQDNDAEKYIKSFVAKQGRKHKAPADVTEIRMGDLDMDGDEDAVADYDVNIGAPGNATISFIAVFLNTNGKFTFLSQIDSGFFGTATGKQLSLDKIVDGKVIVKTFEYQPGDGACCPSKEGVEEYILVRRRLKMVKS
jgi:hypothetical protein